MKKRIVVTGVGIVSPLGVGIQENWERYLSGISGIREFEIEGTHIRTYAGRVSGLELETYIPETKKEKVDRFAGFALVAAKMALVDAKISEEFDREKIGVFIGSAYSGLHSIEKQLQVLYLEGPRRVHPLLMQNNITNASAGEVAIELNLKGPNIGFSCSGCSGDYSIIQAFNTLQRHNIDAIVVGGTEAPLLPRVFEELGPKGLFQPNNTDVSRASCPFDIERKGFVLSEGAGIIVLETLQSAEKRSAGIYGELIGFGTSYCHNNSENHKNTSFSSKVSCIKQALSSASLDPAIVDYVHASGISGVREDAEEAEAIKSILGDNDRKTPVSSTKGSLGFSIGASGPINVIFSLLSLRKHILPQTNSLENIDPKCTSISILKKPDFRSVNTVLSNNFDYAGNNVSFVFQRF